MKVSKNVQCCYRGRRVRRERRRVLGRMPTWGRGGLEAVSVVMVKRGQQKLAEQGGEKLAAGQGLTGLRDSLFSPLGKKGGRRKLRGGAAEELQPLTADKSGAESEKAEVESGEAAFLIFGGKKEEHGALEEGLEGMSLGMQLKGGLLGTGHSRCAPDSRNLIGGGNATSGGGKARPLKVDTPQKHSKGGGHVRRELGAATWKEVQKQAGDNWWADSGRESSGRVCVESEEEEMDVNWGMGWAPEESSKDGQTGSDESQPMALRGRVGLQFEQDEHVGGVLEATPLAASETAGKLGQADMCTSDGKEENHAGRDAERSGSEVGNLRVAPQRANTHIRWGDDSEASEVEEALNAVDMVIETLGSSGGDSPKVDGAAGLVFCKEDVLLGAIAFPLSAKRAARENWGEGDREMGSSLPEDPFGWMDDLNGVQLGDEGNPLGKHGKREKRKEGGLAAAAEAPPQNHV
jgi:hypothetical protein